MPARKAPTKRSSSSGRTQTTRSTQTRGRSASDTGRTRTTNSRASGNQTRNRRSAPSRSSRTYNSRGGGNHSRSTNTQSDRYKLAGFWWTQREGLATGHLESDQIEELIARLEQIQNGSGRASFFLFEADEKKNERSPDFSLYLDEADAYDDRESQRTRGRGRSTSRYDRQSDFRDQDTNDPDDDF